MNENDPFSAFEQERTIIKPGAGRAAPATAQAQGPAAAAPAAAALPDDLPLPQGLNPLLQLAAPLLSAATQLRSMAQHPNPAGLRAALIESVKRFERQAQAKGLPAEHVVAARYILCSFIDECASSTPWGGSGAWSSQSLLVHFHNESWGGEKVFQLLGKLAENVAAQRPLLELLQVVLALGFEGRYRVIDNGRAQLDSVSERLASLLREQAGPPLRELSPQWRGVALGQAKLADGLPLWVLAALAAGLLLLVFIALRLSLHARTDATFDALQAMDVRAATLTPPPPPPAAAPRLAGLLQAAIARGALQVQDLADKSIVTIAGDGFFEPGSAEVAGAVKPLLAEIAAALAQLPGPVTVTGHTDNQPIRSLRFPSNFDLSRERAESVRQLLLPTLGGQRLRAEGVADSRPVADNATPAGRARNRRVEITLAVQGQ
jgi:type VI secretion system protein ImpK